MYSDSKRRRVLMRDGTSFVDETELVRRLLLEGTTGGLTTLKSRNTELYEERYKHPVSSDVTVEDPEPDVRMHQHSKDDITLLESILYNSRRYKGTKVEDDRVKMELEFFDKTSNILFILYVKNLIEDFRDNGVVWGVGRGSSCSSYIMYLLEVNDVNPIKHNIDFSELSKESKHYD